MLQKSLGTNYVNGETKEVKNKIKWDKSIINKNKQLQIRRNLSVRATIIAVRLLT